MKIKVQCDGIIHEFEGKMVKYHEDSETLNIHSSKSGEYESVTSKPLGFPTKSRCFLDDDVVGIFKNWDAIIFEGEEEVQEV